MAYREVSITGWLDPALEYFARQAGIPVSDYAAQMGGEGIGTSLEVLADIFTKGWLNRLIQGGAGALALGYAVWGKDVPTRLRKELLALGMHEGLRTVNNPLGLTADAESLRLFVEAIMRGDWNAALANVFRTPAELGIRAPSPTPAPRVTPGSIIKATTTPPSIGITPATPLSPATGSRYTVRPEELPLGTAPPPGRYVITG